MGGRQTGGKQTGGEVSGSAPAAVPTMMMAVPLVVAFAVGWLVLAAPPPERTGTRPEPVALHAAPDFALPPLRQGAEGFRRADLRGKVSVVNFWATWCAPCRAEMPLLRELAGDGNVPVYGINVRDNPAAADRFLAEAGDPFRRVGSDTGGTVAAGWGVYGLPATFVVDAGGTIVHRLTGPLDHRILERDIRPAIARLAGQ